MNMDSVFFISCFLPLCFAAYFLVPGIRGKNWVLLVLSVLFYSFGSLPGLLVVLCSCAVNFLLLRLLGRERGRRTVLTAGVVWNLALLCLYKYTDFFLGQLGLAGMGLAAPLGISFFAFKCISCLVDAFREPEQARTSLPDLMLYILFFPQIAMGPITRLGEFVPQLRSRSVTLEGMGTGLRRFMAGLGKKLLIAAPLGAMADKIFALESGVLDARLAWLGAVGYCLQLYFDFSGYMDMAIGLGTAFGFTTRENFHYPYTAVSLGDFWRRWHMSLSAWFKDYVYIPLGGNRRGKLRAGIHKSVVFVLCGIWHGANWTFLLWGIWHGLFSMLESLGVIPAKRLSASRGGRALGRVYTLLVVCLGFVMFRAGDVAQGFSVLGAMFTGFSFTDGATVLLHSLLTGQNVVMLILGVVLCLPVGPWLRRCLGSAAEPVSYGLTLVLLVLCLIKLASGNFAPAIYAQF